MKITITVGFIVFLFIAILVNFNWKKTDIEAHLIEADKPKIKFQNLVVNNYGPTTLRSVTTAVRGELLESGVFRAEDGVTSNKFDGNQPAKVRSKKATIQFLSNSVDELLVNPEFNEAMLEEDLRLDIANMTITTESAFYDNIKQLVYTSKPVKIVGVARWTTSRDGFIYDMRNDQLSMTGKVEGAFKK